MTKLESFLQECERKISGAAEMMDVKMVGKLIAIAKRQQVTIVAMSDDGHFADSCLKDCEKIAKEDLDAP